MKNQKTLKIDLHEKLQVFVSDFFSEQMGENISSVQTFLNNGMLIIIARDCLHASELKLASNKLHFDQLLEYKTRQFNEVRTIFERQMEALLECEISRFDTITEQHGVRYIFVTFVSNIDKLVK